MAIEALSQVKNGAERVEQVASKLRPLTRKSVSTRPSRGAAPSQGRIETLLRPPTLEEEGWKICWSIYHHRQVN